MDHVSVTENSSSETTSVVVDDVIHPTLHTALWFIDVAYLLICIVWGTIGNLLILAVIGGSRNFRKRSYIFVAQLAMADLINTAFVMPLILSNVILGTNAAGETLCQVSGAITIFTCGLSVYSIVLIAVQRYLKICRPMAHESVFRPSRTVAIVIFLWLFCASSATPPLFGWSEIQYNPEQFLCGYVRDGSYSYNVFIFVLGSVVPSITIAFCYWKVFREMRRSHTLLQAASTDGLLHLDKAVANKKRATNTILVITVTFALCIGPYCILVVADYRNQLPGIVHKIAAFVALGNSCMNSIIVLTRCKEFREACVRMLFPNDRCCWTKLRLGSPGANPLVGTSSV